MSLQPTGAIPLGFVFIPPGPFVFGGDPAGLSPGPKRILRLKGFCIGRKEVTTQEWFEFVNDPATLDKIAKADRSRYLPRDPDGPLHRKLADGQGYTWHDRAAGFRTTASTPAMGISWHDIHDYLEWRNKKTQADGEKWVYDLPSEAEWEKAARGVDARIFPWGNRFDPSLAVTSRRARRYLYDRCCGFEPRDDSPFGVLDMAGFRGEWTRDRVRTRDPARLLYYARGGHFGNDRAVAVRVRSRATPRAMRRRRRAAQA